MRLSVCKQDWIRELSIKNWRLRMAAMEAKNHVDE
jgi:hypothetical protein